MQRTQGSPPRAGPADPAGRAHRIRGVRASPAPPRPTVAAPPGPPTRRPRTTGEREGRVLAGRPDAGHGPQTVLDALSTWDPTVKGHKADLSKTYTGEFVKKTT